ncbi:MAG: hypothetical protein M3Y42_04680 [Actinomycetota bacterium]|nr:hypothetical protein [Actinomycetota bacterium]MDQ2956242.1 hypothetical protein [Actinomycetota bacterium]
MGAVISGLVPVVGILALVVWASSARRQRTVAGHAGTVQAVVPAADRSFDIDPFGPSHPPIGPSNAPFGPSNAPFGPSSNPFASSGFSTSDGSFGAIEPARGVLTARSTVLGAVRLNEWLFPMLAALLAVGFLLLLLSGDWADLATNLHYSASIDAWDLGLGQLLILSAAEFALFVPLSWNRRTRWPAVLAVFAGCWWGLLCWIAYSVTNGLQQLLNRPRMANRVGGVAVSAGWIWIPVASLALSSVLWGAARLAYLHRLNAPQFAGHS